MIYVAIMGYGTIGSGVAEVLEKNRDVIARHAGDEVRLKYVLDLRDFPGDPIQEKIVHDYKILAEDAEVRMVVETMGGVEPAYTFVCAMLEAGKHVTTSNKALVAEKGAELLSIARQKGINFTFEASVGGGIPIIRPLLTCLTADDIKEVTGIINGTTNYILTKMAEDGSEFSDVLRDAQERGYAEKDPTADIEGHDSCRKIAILTSLICGRQVDFGDIQTEGITGISAADIRCAAAMGRKIRLLATSRIGAGGASCLVAPFLLGASHPLYHVDGVFNAILVRGNALGDAMFYGQGAGKLPTASAVVSDLVDMARHIGENVPIEWEREKAALADPSSMTFRYFVRAEAKRGDIEKIFGSVEYVEPGDPSEAAFLTGEMSGADYEAKAAALGGVRQMIRAI